MQPTAQAVGAGKEDQQSPEGAKEAPVIPGMAPAGKLIGNSR
jgi:hypothetical protein